MQYGQSGRSFPFGDWMTSWARTTEERRRHFSVVGSAGQLAQNRSTYLMSCLLLNSCMFYIVIRNTT